MSRAMVWASDALMVALIAISVVRLLTAKIDPDTITIACLAATVILLSHPADR